MNGIKMEDCEFYVDEEKRTIVCVIDETEDMLLEFILENMSFGDFDLYNAIMWCGRIKYKLKMPNRFVGKAVCAEGDEWNEELGRKLAFYRAKDKCYKSFFKRANLFVQKIDQRLNQAMDMFNEMGAKLDENRDKLLEEIDEMLK